MTRLPRALPRLPKALLPFVAVCSIGGCTAERPQAHAPVADSVKAPMACKAKGSRCDYDDDCCSGSCMDEMNTCR